MESPEDWRWVWLVGAAVFAIGEMASPGSFFLAPFAIGAFVAAVLALADVALVWEWLAFIVVSIAALVALRPLARRLDRKALDEGVGSRRLLGRQATVLRAIPAGDDVGMVRVDREEWRAQSIDGTPIEAGTVVRVADVQGTRVVVAPIGTLPDPSAGTDTPPEDEAPPDARAEEEQPP
jgi:membrane protein implicated in regulation of membrane protease activity